MQLTKFVHYCDHYLNSFTIPALVEIYDLLDIFGTTSFSVPTDLCFPVLKRVIMALDGIFEGTNELFIDQ